jgi:hypothetical protein
MDTALVIHFTRPYPGRETLAFEAFQDAMTFFGKLATDGHCELPEAYMGTNGGGMMVIRGERTKLHELAHGDEFNRLYLKAGFTGKARGRAGSDGVARLVHDSACLQEVARYSPVPGESTENSRR